MAITGYLVRNKEVIWRDIAGEVVVAERNNNADNLRVLNRTASLMWTLADGTRQMEDIVTAIWNRFEVTPEQARDDAEEFCRNLLDAGLASVDEVCRGS